MVGNAGPIIVIPVRRACKEPFITVFLLFSIFWSSAAQALVAGGEECDPNKNCDSTRVRCVSEAELRVRCGDRAAACADPAACRVYLSSGDCISIGIRDDSFDLDELLRSVPDANVPTTYDQAVARCTLLHELTHVKDGCGTADCATEANASAAQAACIDSFRAANCPGRWSQFDCNSASMRACEARGESAMQSCRCASGGGGKGSSCAACIGGCEASMIQCGNSPDYAVEMCQSLNEMYCDGKPLVRPPPPPPSTPTPAPRAPIPDAPNWGGNPIDEN